MLRLAPQARINFAIVRAVLASIHCSEMKKTHGWQWFLCPLIWYYAATLYCCKYYNKDPRERPGLAASAVAITDHSLN
uniref:Uncharacterized protein n=1 Tax=Oryza nivara TaxID=4536 RepID=A0A0E0FH92_ORYNI